MGPALVLLKPVETNPRIVIDTFSKTGRLTD